MPKTAERPATYEDLLQVPEHMVAEIVNGELIVSPRPGRSHARAAGPLFRRIGNAFEDGDGGPGGWWIIFEPELHLGSDVFIPDMGGWRRERVPEYPDAGGCEIAPDWACEVISPGSARIDRVRKLPLYAHYGIVYTWLVDPVLRTIEAYRLEGSHYSLIGAYEGEEPARIEPFEAVELPLKALWL
ncbi:MAG TPA: Uma2 family endonuclease [Thermoanaerobaculia bacterium]